jgi:hypothetical protein
LVHAGWPHTDGVPPPPQVSPAFVQAAHVHVPPQPLLAKPQSGTPPAPVHAVVCGIGTHAGPASTVVVPPSGRGCTVADPHTFGMPAPPQLSPDGHVVPHVTRPPHVSDSLPQFIGMPPDVTHACPGVSGMHAALPPH